ncbi:uroporphyrinogen-III synthase-like isoform X2 [Saccostrea echinata]|uniref:uroporphyrinogen-III synthase-like isoform X2 n=1 Tax=Saccostrea echinata TaxID=191078 RepID=UPI002A7FA03E|nr:uroporphyrinogen-III synthase-like isoform X2 [Saccostrea echinata]
MEIQGSNLVILFKSGTSDDNDPYLKILDRHGFRGHCIPILDFNFINLVQYGQLLKKLDKYLAIVFTSPRAVQATQMVLSSVDIPLSFIKKVKCYTVGKATAQAAKKLGFDPSGECTGNAQLLSEFIVQDSECAENREVLFPCGNLCRDVIRETLMAHIFRLEEIKVYETIAKEDIYDELFMVTKSKVPIHSMVMFSPSGVPVLINTLRKFPQLSFNSLKILAVGPTTESELQKHDIPVYATLRRPDPQSLIECLQK